MATITSLDQIPAAKFDSLHPMCQKCLVRHLNDKGLEFKIQCKPLHKENSKFENQVKALLAAGHTEDDAETNAYALNCEEWARRKLNLPAFSPVQHDIYACTANRKVGRVYRRGGKTVAARVLALHRAYFWKKTILVVAPYDDQIQEFFDSDAGGLQQIIEWAAESGFGELKDMVIRPVGNRSGNLYKQKPRYKMQFANGSSIVGKVLRSSNANRGSSIRGSGVVGLQNVEKAKEMDIDDDNAGVVIIDEADYLDAEDYRTINPIIEQAGADVESLMISTPAGKRETFYENCMITDNYKEIYYPVTERPDIAELPELEKLEKLDEIRRKCRDYDEYEREWLAAFGQEQSTIFKAEDCEFASTQMWRYTDPVVNVDTCPVRPAPDQGSIIRTIGADWNRPGAGLRMWVCEFVKDGPDSGQGYFKFIDRWIVSHSEYTQLAGCNAIMCANRIYRPEYIYVDAGFGDMQVEKLKQSAVIASRDEARGPRHPDAQLLDRLKPISMAQTIPVADPADPNNEDKARKIEEKVLMINFFQAMMEERSVFISDYESQKGGLIPEMISYKIERRGKNGVPVYTAENDHDVVAAGLALYAFWKEWHYDKKMSPLETAMIISGRTDFNPSVDLLPSALKGTQKNISKLLEMDLTPGLLSAVGVLDDPSDEGKILRSINGVPVAPAFRKKAHRQSKFAGRGTSFSRRKI